MTCGARGMLHGDRFARQCRLIEDRKTAVQRPVDRNDVASSYQKTIARCDHVKIDLLKRIVAVPDRSSWRAGQKRSHFPSRMTLGEALEILSAGIHQRDNRSGQLFAEHQRGGHRQRRNDVETDIAAAQTCDDLNDQHQIAPGRRKQPRPIRTTRRVRSTERQSQEPVPLPGTRPKTGAEEPDRAKVHISQTLARAKVSPRHKRESERFSAGTRQAD